MVSSTSSTNHSSSFSTARIIIRNRICFRCSFLGWLFKDWPLDYHNSGAFRTGLGDMIWYFNNKSALSINIFTIYLKWTIVMPGWCLSSFFCDWMFLNFAVLSSKITFDCDIFLYFRIFGCHCIAILFCMIIAVSKQLLCRIKFCWRRWSKSCSLFMINDQN